MLIGLEPFLIIYPKWIGLDGLNAVGGQDYYFTTRISKTPSVSSHRDIFIVDSI